MSGLYLEFWLCFVWFCFVLVTLEFPCCGRFGLRCVRRTNKKKNAETTNRKRLKDGREESCSQKKFVNEWNSREWMKRVCV